MPRYSFTSRGRRTSLAIALAFVLSLAVGASGAQAVVVNLGASGQSGAALVPGTSTAGLPISSAGVSPCDPWLASDLSFQPATTPLCWHGGAVLHSNETFTLTWDPLRRYWASARNYVQQFLRDVGDGSGTFTSPYAVTSQYWDGAVSSNRASNTSAYGGGCIDFGNGGASCNFGGAGGSGHPYPVSGCSTTGASYSASNDTCLTDSEIQTELQAMIPQTGLHGHTTPGYGPVIVVLTPPGVEVCLDGSNTLCSVNSASGGAQFCSYHSHVGVGGTDYSYVVQPWTAHTACDDPGVPPLPTNPTAEQLATDVGARLVSPVSQGQIATIVNPGFHGWLAANGAEINDNGCLPLDQARDAVTVGQNSYFLQPEFNNTGVIESDPNAPACALGAALSPAFVVPSAVNSGDVVQFDGSTTVSSLIVPRANYQWNFGDGTTAVGPSVSHSYANGGTYNVSLKVTDRGGNVASLNQAISVLGPTGVPVSPPSTHPSSGLRAHLQLVPQSLRSVLHSGVSIRVSSNQRADAIATVSISRSAAKRAHIRTGHGPSVVIGRGTVSGIKNGTIRLHLKLSRTTVAKLKHLSHVTLTIRLALVAAGRAHVAVVVAGRY